MNHAWVEKNVGALIVLILIAVSLGGIVEIFPQFFERNLTPPIPGLKPLPALELEGRDLRSLRHPARTDHIGDGLCLRLAQLRPHDGDFHGPRIAPARRGFKFLGWATAMPCGCSAASKEVRKSWDGGCRVGRVGRGEAPGYHGTGNGRSDAGADDPQAGSRR